MTTPFSRTLTLENDHDVIVVGGGPSGCAAALAAARAGARVLLIESTGTLGGLGTSGLVPSWCPFSDKEKIIYRSIAEEIFNATKAGMPHVDPAALDWVPIDPELLKRVYDEKLTEAGVDLLFMSSLCAVEMADDGKVDALVVSSKSGLTAFKARVYIDATGDGDLCAWAGAPFEKGDATGEMQPASLCFIAGNVDNYAYRGSIPGRFLVERNAAAEFPLLTDLHFCNCVTGPATTGFNAGHMWDIDNTDPASVTRGFLLGRQIAAEFIKALHKHHPEGFGNAFLAATAPMLGVRETRRILGDYVLTADDYFARRTFDDEIARNAYPIDIHGSKKYIADYQAGKIRSPMEFHECYGKGESHGIPFRCLIPQRLSNVLVSGRCISTDRIVQGSTRVMPVCLATGEAAGLAAALAVRDNTKIRDVDPDELRATLKRNGAYIY